MQGLGKLKPLGLLLLRVGLGIIFISHGYPKLFTNTRGFMEFFARNGFPPSFVYVAGVLEFFGGILLIAGLFTRIAGLLLTLEVGVNIWRLHLPQGPITQVSNYEFPLALAVSVFALATVGAGLLSLDHLIFREGRKALRKPRDKG